MTISSLENACVWALLACVRELEVHIVYFFLTGHPLSQSLDPHMCTVLSTSAKTWSFIVKDIMHAPT